MNLFQPTPLPYISPTSVNQLRQCMLRVAFDSDVASRVSIMFNPAAHLGSVCHRVLESIGKGAISPNADWNASFEQLWQSEVTKQEMTVHNNLQDQNLGAMRYWRGYAIKRARLKHLAYQLWLKQRYHLSITNRPPHSTGIEFRYTAFQGQMRGTADMVRWETGELIIEDYKTGVITDHDEVTGDTILRESYRQQLLLYAAMHHDTTSHWPTRARLIPLEGVPIEFPIDKVVASHVAAEALDLLKQYNNAVTNSATQSELANPSAIHCHWCPYKTVCDTLWEHITPEWEWNHHTVEGVVTNLKFLQTRVVADLHVSNGSIASGFYHLHSINASISTAITQFTNQSIRISELKQRDNILCTTTTSLISSLQ